jgi:hypothetical protein
MSSIDIVCVLEDNAIDYFKFMKYTCELLKSGNHTINYICVGLNSDLKELQETTIKYDKEVDVYPSMYHANAIHSSFEHIKSEYTIFIDADVALLQKNWDVVVVNLLHKFSCTGFQYRFSNFPGIIMFACKKDAIKTIDFHPTLNNRNTRSKYKIQNIDEANVFGVKIGTKIPCDSGWKLPLTFNYKNKRPKTMVQVYGDSYNSQLPFCNKEQIPICLNGSQKIRMKEFHLDGKIFGTHLKQSRNTKFDDEFCMIWRNRIALFLKQTK